MIEKKENANIIVKNLNIGFSTGTMVKDVSIEFEKDKITSIIGESGSGKSLLVTSILRLLPESAKISGTVEYMGEDLLKTDYKRIRKIRGEVIGFIPQNPTESFNKVLKIRPQLDEILKAHQKNLSKKQRYTIIKDSLIQLGFENPDKILSSYPMQLSGGMMQRVLSLFGTLANPKWIIADEPTKGLDAILRNQVFSVLKNIQQTKASSMIIVTHDLGLAYHISDKIIVMRSGKVVEQGTPQQVFKSPSQPYTKILLSSMPQNMIKGDKYVSTI